MSEITGHDRITVARPVEDESQVDYEDEDGQYEELEVFNHVNVQTRHYVNSVNGHETFDPIIGAGDMDTPPEYVTRRIAEYLWTEWGIDLDSLEVDIGVVDMTRDDIKIV